MQGHSLNGLISGQPTPAERQSPVPWRPSALGSPGGAYCVRRRGGNQTRMNPLGGHLKPGLRGQARGHGRYGRGQAI